MVKPKLSTSRAFPAAWRGSSMIEVLIAFLVLALGITSLVSFQARITNDSSYAKARSDATNIASTKIEQLRNYESLAVYDAIASGTDTVSGTTQTYTRVWTVTTTGNYKTVQVAVSWPDRTGSATADTTVTLNTIIARVDPVQTPLAVGSTTTTTVTSTTWATTTTTSTSSTSTSSSSTTTATSTTTTTTTTTSTSTTSSTTTSSTTTTTAGASYTITISGSIAKHGGSGITESVSISPGGSCSDDGSSYTCTSSMIAGGDSWSGTVSISTNKVVCGSNSYSFTNVTSDQTANFVLGKTAGDCP